MIAAASQSRQSLARLAVDIGGTFTDVVLEPGSGERITSKLLTTYDHPGNAVLKGIAEVIESSGINAGHVGLIIHGTTLATNALIERNGAKTALLTTEGHRDALEMAHEDRFEQYDINIDRPVPLVPRFLRLPVRERMDRDGRILIPLDEASVISTLPVLDEHRIESVAIGYLHGFINPEHELRTSELLRAARPDLSITLASEVAPEIREFERMSTACANAYVRPLMAKYLERLAGELRERGFHCPFLMMTSGGGLTTLETAAKFPIRLVESGPAGGAILSQYIAGQLSLDRMLSFDMGGTTAKLCLIDEGQPLMSRRFEVDRVYRFKKGSGLPIRIPVIEMVEIGAGGGSIASIDKLLRIQVGPESAGSEPGPAAYGRGGDRPTGHRCRCSAWQKSMSRISRVALLPLIPRRRTERLRRISARFLISKSTWHRSGSMKSLMKIWQPPPAHTLQNSEWILDSVTSSRSVVRRLYTWLVLVKSSACDAS